MASGYSKTPLAKKLGIKEKQVIYLYNAPSDYFQLFEDFPNEVLISNNFNYESYDFIHVFCRSILEFEKEALFHKAGLKKNGMMWISWPKGKSTISTDLKRDYIREFLLKIGLVDVKVASVDDDWSALKFVYRLKDR